MNNEAMLQFIQAAAWKGSCLGLERMQELMHRLGDPQNGLKFVHVAGTNGKGSASVMLAGILSAAGYKTGLYTSPHLRIYNERMVINGRMISDEEMCAAAEAVKAAVDTMTDDCPTEFERVTAMAFWHFAAQKCDIVVLEVGLGGLLDATNIIPAPELALITNLGLEHTAVLGDTIEEIAAHKAGIIKPGCDAVLYNQSAAAVDVVRQICAEKGCPLTITDETRLKALSGDLFGQHLCYRHRADVFLRLIGTYQLKNAALVLDAVDRLTARGWNIPESAVEKGLAEVSWPARFEILRREPLVLLDGAHNPNGVEALAGCLSAYLPDKKAIFMMGVMADKDFTDMLVMLAPFMKEFIAVQPDYYRALSSAAFAETARAHLSVPVTDGGTVPEGVALALDRAGKDDVIVICGSLYQAGEVRQCFGLL